MKPFTLSILILTLAAQFAFAQPATTKKPEEWLDLLKKSDTPQDIKHNACRELGIMNHKAAVPVLAALLPDEQMSHMARYGLEMITDPSADDALRAALSQAKGKQLAGVIGSIGKRRDPKAVEPLAAFLKDPDPTIAGNTAMALGRIATPEAAQALRAALAADLPKPTQAAIADGLLAAADNLMAANHVYIAAPLFDLLRQSPVPRHIKMGAIRGAILARKSAGIPLFSECLASTDDGAFAAALRVAHEAPGPEITRALCAALPKMYEHRQVIALQVLGMRADPAALPAVLSIAKTGEAEAKLQAVKSLVPLGDASIVPQLVEWAVAADTKLATAATNALISMPATGVDAALIAAAEKGDPKPRALAIEVLGQRKATGAADALVKAAADPDEAIRLAAIKSLAEVGADAQVAPMVAMTLAPKSPKDLEALERSLSAICLRSPAKEAASQHLLDAMTKADPTARKSLLKIIKSAGGAKAYPTVRNATQDTDPEIRDIAIRSLCDWPGPEAADDLLNLAKTSPNNTYRTLALRGYIRLAGSKELPDEKRLEMCTTAMNVATRDEERRQVLGSLSTVARLDALKMVMAQVGKGKLNEEACAAAVGIGDLLTEKNQGAAEVNTALRQVLKETGNRGTERKARSVLNRLAAKK